MRLKRASIAFAASVGAVLVASAAAFACTDLVGVNYSRPAAPPGAVIRMTASSFSTSVAGNPIVLHWGPTAEGAILAEAPLDQSGNFDATFTVPDVAPGYYLVTLGEKGDSKVSRTRFQVLGAGSSAKSPPAPIVLPGTVPEPNSNGVIALAAGIGAFGLGLFGAGFVAFTREARRRRRVPVAVTSTKS